MSKINSLEFAVLLKGRVVKAGSIPMHQHAAHVQVHNEDHKISCEMLDTSFRVRVQRDASSYVVGDGGRTEGNVDLYHSLWRYQDRYLGVSDDAPIRNTCGGDYHEFSDSAFAP